MNHLALPLKTTICWQLLTIILLRFFLVKMYNFEQSAGNLLLGASETIRSPRKINTGIYSPCIQNSLIHLHNHKYNLKYNICFYSISDIFFYKKNRASSVKNMRNRGLAKHAYFSSLARKHKKSETATQAINNTKDLKSLKIYDIFKDNRLDILKQQKDKSGVYCFINKINGNSYVGSSINLASRMKNYLNNTFLKSKQNINMPIVKALLKYNQENFSLLILEYAEPKSLTIRETYYITYVMPYYNVLKQGYSSLGYKHTEETKRLLSELAKNRIHSVQTKSLIARALTGENNPFYNKSHSIESKVRIIEAKSAYSVYVYNSFKELLVIFPSASTLAKLIKSNHHTIVDNIKEQTIFRGEWYFTNIPYSIDNIPKISDWTSKQCEKLILDINSNSHIRKAVFVYDIDGKYLSKYDGVTKAQQALNINHCIIKKYAKLNGTYKNYIFSYERLMN
nr:GIY endonuclease [Ophiocordyceps lanpingensis]